MASSSGHIQFGSFELNPRTGELRKQGIRVRLQPKPLQILNTLIAQPGEVVTREQLKSRLWPGDTFVDFEGGVNTAVNRLRIALGDSADHPRYVETVSRLGYRFIAPVLQRGEPVLMASDPPSVPPKVAKFPTRPILAFCAIFAIALSAAIRFPPLGSEVHFRPITYHRGQVGAARFVSGGQGILYVAQWNRDVRRLYAVNTGNPAARALGFENLGLAAVSRSGELALLRSGGTMNITGGTLWRASIDGGPFQQVEQNIFGADWSPDGSRLAVVRVVAGAQQLEYPIGRILYRTSGWLSSIRVSPSGDAVAFIDHPVRHDDAGSVLMVNSSGQVTTLASGWASAAGLAWRKRDEVWFSAARDSFAASVLAASTSGVRRVVGRAPGSLTLRDVAPDGRALLTVESRRLEIAGALAGEQGQRDFSLTDWSRVQELSADGSLLLFDESGAGAGGRSIAYLRRTHTEETVRLRDGIAQGFAAGGASAIVLDENRTQLWNVPLSGGPGDPLPASGLNYQWVRPFSDGARLLALANLPKQPLRLYVQQIKTGKAGPLTGPMMVRNAAIAGDGEAIAMLSPEGKLLIYPVGGGPPREIASEHPLAPVRWSRDGEWLYVTHLRSSVQSSADVSRLRVSTGEVKLWKTLSPDDPAGVNSITGVAIADDEQSYAYSFRRVLSALHMAEGWK